MTKRTFAVPLVMLFALLAIFGFPDMASAVTEYINIPAAGFPLGANTTYSENFGNIESSGPAEVRTAVIFKTQGLNICRLNLYARDFDPVNDVTARLIRRRVAPDGTSFGPAPETIAEVSSTGNVDQMRLFADTSITEPLVAPAYAYWVDIEFGGGPIQFFGVRIVSMTTCP